MNQHINTPHLDELYHHDIMGMKCGIRRFQNPDESQKKQGECL